VAKKPDPAAEPPPLVKLPKTLGACADLYASLRDERLAAEKVAAAIGEREKFVAEHLINSISAADSTGVAGKVARVTRRTRVVAQVKDWALFNAYVLKVKRPDLLQRRLNEAAIGELWDAKKVVPGVEPFTIVSLSVAKA
jgi:hypothetical protein